MLIEFSVENYLSFKDRATLSMVAATREEATRRNVVVNAQGSGQDLLRSVGVYGPNAAGKSNLLEAIWYMRWFVGNSAQKLSRESVTRVVPFKLDQRCASSPSSFEVVFLVEGVRYRYGFSVTSERVHEEWLSYYPLVRERVLFRRDWSAKGKEKEYDFGPSWSGATKRIADLTRPNALYLSVAAQLNHPLVQPVYDWFQEHLRGVSLYPQEGSELSFTERRALKSPKAKRSYLAFLQQADLGIESFDVQKKSFQETDFFSALPEQLREKSSSKTPNDAEFYEVSTTHRGVDKSGRRLDVSLRLDEESDGTQKLFAMAGPWEYVLANGCVMVVDELDGHLHPLLTKWLVSSIHSKKTNAKNAQLIFATHDINLLQEARLRRDQIWFVEKGSDGGSELYSLWDFKKRGGKAARKEENIRMGYLRGRYGAIPILEEAIE